VKAGEDEIRPFVPTLIAVLVYFKKFQVRGSLSVLSISW